MLVYVNVIQLYRLWFSYKVIIVLCAVVYLFALPKNVVSSSEPSDGLQTTYLSSGISVDFTVVIALPLMWCVHVEEGLQ